MVGARAIEPPGLVGVDWGSTSLRVFLIGVDGRLLDSRASDAGCSAMDGDPAAYRAALARHAGDWLDADPDLPLLVCGMAGSKHGWHEVPYADCPADLAQLPLHRLPRPAYDSARFAAIVPGLLHAPAAAPPDVMRGEEVQLAGALVGHPALASDSVIVLPGTHSKWARIVDGRAMAFATHMTGELYALLSRQSVLARLMPVDADGHDEAGFLAGVRAARDAGPGESLSHQLFAVRTLGLTQRLAPSALADYLSGLLIGHELRAGLAWRDTAGCASGPLALVGEPSLCRRYAQALAAFDAPLHASLANTVPAGLWSLARRAGLLQPSRESV